MLLAEIGGPLHFKLTIDDVRIIFLTNDPNGAIAQDDIDSCVETMISQLCNIVVVTSSRVFGVVEKLISSSRYNGLILMTEPVYRIGQRANDGSELMIEWLEFHEVRYFRGISLTPLSNGVGLGGAHWLVSRENGAGLCDFSALVVIGVSPDSTFHPSAMPDGPVQLILVLPQAIGWDHADAAHSLAGAIEQQQNACIPTFIDDGLIEMLMRLRKKGIGREFRVSGRIRRTLASIEAFAPGFSVPALKCFDCAAEHHLSPDAVYFIEFSEHAVMEGRGGMMIETFGPSSIFIGRVASTQPFVQKLIAGLSQGKDAPAVWGLDVPFPASMTLQPGSLYWVRPHELKMLQDGQPVYGMIDCCRISGLAAVAVPGTCDELVSRLVPLGVECAVDGSLIKCCCRSCVPPVEWTIRFAGDVVTVDCDNHIAEEIVQRALG